MAKLGVIIHHIEYHSSSVYTKEQPRYMMEEVMKLELAPFNLEGDYTTISPLDSVDLTFSWQYGRVIEVILRREATEKETRDIILGVIVDEMLKENGQPSVSLHVVSFNGIKVSNEVKFNVPLLEDELLHISFPETETKEASLPAPAPKGRRKLLVPIEELDLPWQVRGWLSKAELKTAGDLASKTEEELLAIKGVGPVVMAAIKSELSRLGLSIRT